MQKHPFRDLDAYKAQHKERMAKKGLLREFMACETLTSARAMAFGDKRKAKHRRGKPMPALEG